MVNSEPCLIDLFSESCQVGRRPALRVCTPQGWPVSLPLPIPWLWRFPPRETGCKRTAPLRLLAQIREFAFASSVVECDRQLGRELYAMLVALAVRPARYPRRVRPPGLTVRPRIGTVCREVAAADPCAFADERAHDVELFGRRECCERAPERCAYTDSECPRLLLFSFQKIAMTGCCVFELPGWQAAQGTVRAWLRSGSASAVAIGIPGRARGRLQH